MTRERDDSGRYVETVGERDVLGVVDSVDGPAITSSDVSAELKPTTRARDYDRRIFNRHNRRTGRQPREQRQDASAVSLDTVPRFGTGRG